jgi:Fe2+ or Zn2+ uptake regulation protein
MTSFQDVQNANIRLVVLQMLQQDADYSVNENILRSALEPFGHRIGLDKLRTELGWLEEQGLMEVERVASGKLWVAKLTNRGLDVAEGRSVAPGVERPRPE